MGTPVGVPVCYAFGSLVAAATAAVALTGAAVPVPVTIAATAAAQAEAYAVVAEQEQQNDDPKEIVTVAHREYLQIFLADEPLIPWYSAGEKMCRP